jgi:hypothetical protein
MLRKRFLLKDLIKKNISHRFFYYFIKNIAKMFFIRYLIKKNTISQHFFIIL